MNGFKDDVISILRDNVLLHAEAMGLVWDAYTFPEAKELLKDLESKKFPVTDRVDKHVFLFDYVVIPSGAVYVTNLLKVFSLVSKLGIIIIEITGKADVFNNRYVSLFGDFSINKLKYQDRAYLVITNGADYGN